MIPSEFTVLFEATLRALIAALAVWAGLRLLRVKNVPAQKAAWGLMLVAALAMPLLMRWQWVPAWTAVKLPLTSLTKMAAPVDVPFSAPAPVVPISSPGKPETVAQTHSEAREDFPAPGGQIRSAGPIHLGVPIRSAARVHSTPITEHQSAPISPTPAEKPAAAPAAQPAGRFLLLTDTGRVLAIAWILYLGVCAALLFRLLWGLASSFRLWIEAKPVVTLTNLDLPGSIHVRSSGRIASPVNIGSGILLPAGYPEWDKEKLRVVLAHERAHIVQRDFYLQMMAGLYANLTWFSPLGWWLKRKLSELGEAISDRAGLDAASSPSAYAQLLLEFAAQPRTTFTGVAMAHSRNLSNRIERLLNDSSFRLAFSGGRRALLALLLPVALIAATAMVRVEAAQAPQSAAATLPSIQSSDQAPAAPAAPSPYTGQAGTGQSNVTQAAVLFSGQSPDQAPAPPQPAPAPSPAAAPSPDAAPAAAAAPAPPPPPAESQDSVQVVVPPIPPIDVHVDVPPMPPMRFMKGYEGRASCFADGDAYAIVGDPGTKTRFCGNTGGEMEAEVEKARSVAHGHFLLFRHEGKYYIVDDPATVSRIEDMNKALQDQGDKMRALGEQFRDAGRDAREQARKERETAANIPAPDLSKEMAELNASVASLTAKQGAAVPREELQQVQREISAIQRRLIESEVKVDVNIDMSKFNVEMGKFNEQMSQLGTQLGQTAQGNQRKIESIIDDSLKSGKAKPVN